MRAAILAWLLLMAAPAAAQERDASRPNGELPRHVLARAGALSVFADFTSATSEAVPVYLVNRSGAPVVLETQDGDPFLVREAEVDGRWVRTEPFVFSDCGLSYYSLTIPPGRFVRRSMRSTDAGEPGTVRYRLAQHSAHVVSNTGPGRFSRADVRAAANDVLAMQTADVRAIESALSRTPPLSREERAAAFRRLSELPAASATPPLLRVLGDGASRDEDLDHAIGALRVVDAGALIRHVLGLLERAPSRLRTQTLARVRWMEGLGADALHRRLLALVAQPRDPDLQHLMALLAASRRPDVRPVLSAIATDARYATQARIAARYQLEQWFGTQGVRVLARPIGNYSDGHRVPVRMEVRLTNTSGRAIDFRYGALTDFITLYVTRDSGLAQELVPPRPSVRWLTTPGATSTAVHLAPGEERVFPFALLDYFDLPRDRGSSVTVWVSVHLPGVHDVPQLGGGSGVNVQP